ncbi:MAG: hypothetical protein AUJ97_04820 [Bacteroidetes bacterium CG2_30_32_10]|nr:MAG: hypothetical protein AUJ97_04820 [Bacteroidetes bacterium CG2_30_32_10]
MINNKIIKNKYLIILIIISFLFLFFFYGKVITHPNSYLFSNSGDGIKNYYTYAFHINNDNSYIEMQGMNYPYGENFLYTDCQPLFTLMFKTLSGVFPSIGNFCIGFINLLMILSFLITSILLYLILSKLKVNPLLSILGAFGITVLSPQIFRMMGHLALSYSFFIPLTWYLIIKYYESPRKIKWVVILCCNNVFWFFTHAYLGMISTSFLFFIWIFDFIFQFKIQYKLFKNYLPFLISILIPILLFELSIIFTDTHIGRTNNPLGFFSYNAELDDIFLPNHPPLKPLLDRVQLIKQNWEAWNYIGISSIIAIIVFFILTIKNIVKTKTVKFNNKYFTNYQLKITIIASIVLLFYAFGEPFKQFHQLLNWLHPLKAFRATGRFAWVFYYVITISSLYFFNNIINSMMEKRKVLFGSCLMILLPSLFVIEGWSYHQEASKEIVKEVNLFDKKQLTVEYKDALGKINSQNYQAIIPLPFYYNGSDCFSRPVQNHILTYSMVISYHTKLPICAAYLTRIAIPESKNIVQIVSPDFYEKQIEKDLKNTKPFLVLRSNESLSIYEQDIINKSRLIFKNANFTLYELKCADLFKNNATAQIDSFQVHKNKFFSKSGFIVSDTSSFLYYNDFNNNSFEKSFRGKGALTFKKEGKNTIVKFPPNSFNADKEYQVSAWMYNAKQESLSDWFRFIVEEYNIIENKWESTMCLPTNSEVINGDWSLIEMKFKVLNPNNSISIVTIGKKYDRENVYIDDLLIREINTDVYKVVKQNNFDKITELFKNNQQIINK